VKDRKLNVRPRDLSRRHFLQVTGAASLAAGAACQTPTATGPAGGGAEAIDPAQLEHPPSEGYLLVDSGKCQGCATCMLACSLVHEGEENPSLARIQVLQNPYGRFPHDVSVVQCRQCVEPGCVEACPEGAMFVDTEHGNVRRVDEEKCVGCGTCINACPHPPSRVIWDPKRERPRKCDLCLDTPHWEAPAGEARRLACMEACPVDAIALLTQIPTQQGDAGYDVNLRDEVWEQMGYARE